MARINLRLTDEQHDELRLEAFRKRLSLQKVIVGRLFREAALVEDGVARGTVPVGSPVPGRVAPSSTSAEGE